MLLTPIRSLHRGMYLATTKSRHRGIFAPIGASGHCPSYQSCRGIRVALRSRDGERESVAWWDQKTAAKETTVSVTLMQLISPFKRLFPQQQQQTLNCLCVSLFHINLNDFFTVWSSSVLPNWKWTFDLKCFRCRFIIKQVVSWCSKQRKLFGTVIISLLCYLMQLYSYIYIVSIFFKDFL